MIDSGNILTEGELSKHALALAKGRVPARKELALDKCFDELLSLVGHLCNEESEVAIHSQSSPCKAKERIGPSSEHISKLSRDIRSVK